MKLTTTPNKLKTFDLEFDGQYKGKLLVRRSASGKDVWTVRAFVKEGENLLSETFPLANFKEAFFFAVNLTEAEIKKSEVRKRAAWAEEAAEIAAEEAEAERVAAGGKPNVE